MAYSSEGVTSERVGAGNQPAVGDRLRELIEDGGGVYRVSKDTGLSTAALYRFLEGGDLRGASVEILAEHFGYELRPAPRRKRRA